MPDLFDQLFRASIGYDPLRKFVDSIDFNNYPPYNIEKTVDAPIYALTMAVAGFKRQDIEVSLEADTLTIKGQHSDTQDTDATEYLYRGLSLRGFKREFQLGKNVEVTNVSLNDGLLVVVLQENVPESSRKKFDIK